MFLTRPLTALTLALGLTTILPAATVGEWEPESDAFLVVRLHDAPRTVARYQVSPYPRLIQETVIGRKIREELLEEPAEEIGNNSVLHGLDIMRGIHQMNWSFKMERHYQRPRLDDPSFQMVLAGPSIPLLEAAFVRDAQPTVLPVPAGAPFVNLYQQRDLQIASTGDVMIFQYHEQYPNRVAFLPLPQLRSTPAAVINQEADIEAELNMQAFTNLWIELANHPDNKNNFGELTMLSPAMTYLSGMIAAGQVSINETGMHERIDVSFANLPTPPPADQQRLAALPASTAAALAISVDQSLLDMWQPVVPAPFLPMVMEMYNGALTSIGLPPYDQLVTAVNGTVVVAIAESEMGLPGIYLSVPCAETIGLPLLNLGMHQLGLAGNGDGRANGVVEGHTIEIGYRDGILEISNHPAGLDHFHAGGFLEHSATAARLAAIDPSAWAIGLSRDGVTYSMLAAAVMHAAGEYAPPELLELCNLAAELGHGGHLAITPSPTGCTIDSAGLVSATLGSIAGGAAIDWMMWQIYRARRDAARAQEAAQPSTSATPNF